MIQGLRFPGAPAKPWGLRTCATDHSASSEVGGASRVERRFLGGALSAPMAGVTLVQLPAVSCQILTAVAGSIEGHLAKGFAERDREFSLIEEEPTIADDGVTMNCFQPKNARLTEKQLVQYTTASRKLFEAR